MPKAISAPATIEQSVVSTDGRHALFKFKRAGQDFDVVVPADNLIHLLRHAALCTLQTTRALAGEPTARHVLVAQGCEIGGDATNPEHVIITFRVMDGAEFSFGLTQEILSQLLQGLQARLTATAPASGRRH